MTWRPINDGTDLRRDYRDGFYAEVGPEHGGGASWTLLRRSSNDVGGSVDIDSGRCAGGIESAKSVADTMAQRYITLTGQHSYHFDESRGNLYEVTLKVAVEVAFDQTPSERELRIALVENAIDYIEHRMEHNADEFITDVPAEHLAYEWVDRVSLG